MSTKLIDKVFLNVDLFFPNQLTQYGGGHRPHRLVFRKFEKILTVELLNQLIKHLVPIELGGNNGVVACSHVTSHVADAKKPCFHLRACVPARQVGELPITVGALVTAGWSLDEKGLKYHQITPVTT